MTLRKRRILSLIAILCIALAFFLRRRNEQVTFMQICPAIAEGTFQGELTWDGMDTHVDVTLSDEIFREILSDTRLQHGKKTTSLDRTSINIRVIHPDGNYSITVGSEGNVTAAKIGDLEGTRTFWKDPGNRLFAALYDQHLAAGGTIAPNVTTSIMFGSMDFSLVDTIKMTNGHNGNVTRITDPEAIGQIVQFLKYIRGENGTSAKGYYEGSYSLTLLSGGEEIFAIGFGDSPAFYYGDFGDGYPVRYELTAVDIQEVIDLLAPFENS